MKQKNKKALYALASLLTLPVILPLAASKCKPNTPNKPDNPDKPTPPPVVDDVKKELNDVAKNITLDVEKKSSKEASKITKENILFSNYDTQKYEVSILNLSIGDDPTILNVTYVVKKIGTDKVSDPAAKTITGFKLPKGQYKRPKSDVLIKKEDKIRYLSIGDSISAGFTGELDQDYHGEFKNGNVSGMSLAAYLAYYLNKIDSGKRLESFKNFATTNSTIWEWLDLLDADYTPTDPKYKKEHSVYQGTFYRFSDKAKLKEELIKEIQNANLMTMTLGANDFLRIALQVFEKVGLIDDLQKMFLKGQFDQQKLLKFLVFLRKAKNEIQARMETLLNKIKEINPNLNINVLNYPAPFYRLLSSLLSSAPIPNELKSSASLEFLMDQLSDPLKTAVKNVGDNTNFIDMVDNSFWNKNQKDLTKILFDLHPTPYGYKKLAQDVFVRLISHIVNKEALQNLGWTKKYTNKTNDAYKWQIETNESVSKIYKDIIGENPQDAYNKLFEKDELYRAIEPKLNGNNLSNRLQGFPEEYIQEIFMSIVNKIFQSDFLKKIDPDENIPNFFKNQNKAALKALIKWFVKSDYLKKNLDKAQELAQKAASDEKTGNINFADLTKILNETLFDPQELLKLAKEILSSDFTKEFKDEFTDAITRFVQNALKYGKFDAIIGKLIDKTYDSVKTYIPSKEQYKNLLTKIITHEKMPKFFGQTLKSLLTSIGENSLDSIDSFNGLIKAFFANQTENGKIAQEFSELFNALLKDADINTLFGNILADYISTAYPEIMQQEPQIEKNELKKLVGAFINSGIAINDKFNFDKMLANSLLNELKTNGLDFKFDTFAKTLANNFKDFALKNYETLLIESLKIVSSSNELKDPQIQKTFKKLFVNVYKYLDKQFGFKQKLLELIKSQLPALISENDFNEIFDSFVSDDNLEKLANFILNITSNNDFDWTKIKSLKDLSNAIFSSNKTNPVKFIKDILSSSKDNEKFINVVYKLINSTSIFEGIDEDNAKKIVKTILSTTLKIDDELAISNDFAKFVVEKLLLWNPNERLDFKAILLEFANNLKSQIKDKETLIKIVKVLLSDIDLEEAILEKLFDNLYKLIKSKLNLADYAWNFVGSKLSSYISENEFKTLTTTLLNNESAQELLRNTIVKTFLSMKKQDLSNLKTFSDLLKIALNKDGYLYKELPNVLKKIFTEKLTSQTAKTLITKFAKRILSSKAPQYQDKVTEERIEKLLALVAEYFVKSDEELKYFVPTIQWIFRYIADKNENFDVKQFSIDLRDQIKAKLLERIKGKEEYFGKEFATLFTEINNKHHFSNLIWLSIGSKLSSYISENEFKTLTNNLVTLPETKQFLEKFMTMVLKSANAEMLSSLTLVDNVIKQFFKPNAEITKNFAKEFTIYLTSVLKNETIRTSFATIVKNYLHKNYPDYLNNFDDNKINELIKVALSAFVNIESNTHILENDLNLAIKELADKGTKIDVKVLINKIKSNILDNKFALFKAIMKTDDVKTAKELFKSLLTHGYGLFKDKFNLKEVISNALSAFMDVEKVSKILDELLNNDVIEEIYNTIFDTMFNNLQVFEKANNFTEYVTELFKNDGTKLSTLIEKTLTSILNKQNIKEALFTLFNEYKLIDEFTENDKNDLISFIPKLIKTLDNKFKLTENAILKLTTFIDNNEFGKIKTNLFGEILANIKEQINTPNKQFKLFAWILKDNTFANKKYLIGKLIANIYSFGIEKFLPNLEDIYTQLPNSVQEFITKEQFDSLLSSIIKSSYTKQFIKDVVDIMFSKNFDFDNVETYISFAKKILVEIKDDIKPKFIAYANNILGTPAIQNDLVAIIKNVAKSMSDIVFDDKHDEFFKKLLAHAFTIFDDVKLYDTFSNAIINNLDDPAKFVETIKNTIINLPFTDPKWLISILTQTTIKESKADVIKLIEDIFGQYINDETKIEKLLTKLNLVNVINKDSNTQDITKQFIISVLKNAKTKELISKVIETIFDNAETLKDSERWVDVIQKLANSTSINDLKTLIKEFIESVITSNDLFSKQIDITLNQMFLAKPELYRTNIVEKNKNNTVAKFMDSFLKSIVKEKTLFEQIYNNVFEQLKHLPTNTDNQIMQLIYTIIKGASKIVATSDFNPSNNEINIDLVKAVALGNNIYNIMKNVDPISYVNFINYMFEVTKFSLDGGLYSFLFTGTLKDSASKHLDKMKLKSRSARALQQLASTKEEKKYEPVQKPKISIKYNMDISTIVSLLNNISPLLQSTLIPAVKSYITDISNKKYENIKDVKKLDSYKAITRIYTSLLLLAYPQTYNKEFEKTIVFFKVKVNLFWQTGTFKGLATEGFTSTAVYNIIRDLLFADTELKNKITTLYNTNESANIVGLNRFGQYDEHFFAGTHKDSRSEDFKQWKKHSDDSILAFIWNHDKKDTEYHNEENIVLIAKALQYGYLYKDMDKDNE